MIERLINGTSTSKRESVDCSCMEAVWEMEIAFLVAKSAKNSARQKPNPVQVRKSHTYLMGTVNARI